MDAVDTRNANGFFYGEASSNEHRIPVVRRRGSSTAIHPPKTAAFTNVSKRYTTAPALGDRSHQQPRVGFRKNAVTAGTILSYGQAFA